MKNQKKHLLIKHAYDNYPKGTKAIALGLTKSPEFECSGIYTVDDFGVKCKSGWFIYNNSGKWAEIVPDKIAVRVENELEFRALMEFYESKGWKHAILGNEAIYHESSKIITYKNDWYFYSQERHLGECYTIKSFPDFAKDHGLKVPLLISEDGKVVYEGHKDLIVVSIDTKEIFDEKLHKHPVFGFTEDKYKFFTTIEAAEKWIEANNPKEKEIQLYFGLNAKININIGEVFIYRGGEPLARLSTGDIKDIYCAINDLENG